MLQSVSFLCYTMSNFVFKMEMFLQVNLCQKHLFLHQLTHNMTTDFLFLFWHSEQFMYTTCSELVVFMYWTRNSMNNILSYYGLVDARISASEKDLPVLRYFALVTFISTLKDNITIQDLQKYIFLLLLLRHL